MSRLIKFAFIIITIALFTTLAACAVMDITEQFASDNDDEVATIGDELLVIDKSSLFTENEKVIVANGNESLNNGKSSLSPEDIVDYESYRKHITSVSNFEPYYQLIFDFGTLSGGISSVPIENVIAMYNELRTVFEFINVVSHRPLYYFGNYEGNTRFVYRYEWYKSTGAYIGSKNPLNRVGHDSQGNEIVTTPINTVIMCENIISRFDSCVAKGRNLQKSDFSHSSLDKPISVVLGNAYRSIYEIGDIFSLIYLYVVLNFEVVGFYESGVDFSMDAGALQDVDIDYSIVMPYFIPTYEPVGEDTLFLHRVHIAELTSGYIAITEPISEISDATHQKYMAKVEEIAGRHSLSGTYICPLWPVGFVFA